MKLKIDIHSFNRKEVMDICLYQLKNIVDKDTNFITNITTELI